MATGNPFEVLGGGDNDDPSLIAAQQQKLTAKKAAPVPAKEAVRFPSKPVPPAKAVRDAKSVVGPARGGIIGGRGDQGRVRGGYEGNRVHGNGNGYGFAAGGGEDWEIRKPFEREHSAHGGPRQPYRSGHRGGYANGEVQGDSVQPTKRVYERRSGTGRGNELKREGSGRGNWGTMSDDVIALENANTQTTKNNVTFFGKQHAEERPTPELNTDHKEDGANNKAEKEEDKEMTLEEYEKIREGKRKTLLAKKAEERKVDMDEEFGSMRRLSNKKDNDDISVQLDLSKESRKTKDSAEKDDRAKKSISINEFLKPKEGGSYYYGSGDRGWGRGGVGRGPYVTNEGCSRETPEAIIKIKDPGHFPILGGK